MLEARHVDRVLQPDARKGADLFDELVVAFLDSTGVLKSDISVIRTVPPKVYRVVPYVVMGALVVVT